MQTDIPLKRLTTLRAADLLPLFGVPAAAVTAVETHELPAVATRLDTLLRVVSPQGQPYHHIIEWQGYPDPLVLWRLVGYMAAIAQRDPALPTVGTVVYLFPPCDVGATLHQTIDGQSLHEWRVRVVRLWQHDAQQAVASGVPGLAALSPLMAGADAALVEQAAAVLRATTPRREQSDLLTILGVFAAPLLDTRQFIERIGKEQLMESDLIDYLMEEKLAAIRTELRAEYEAARQAEVRETLRQAVAESIAVRFPGAPPAVAAQLAQVADPQALRGLLSVVLTAEDVAAVQAAVQAAAHSEPPDDGREVGA